MNLCVCACMRACVNCSFDIVRVYMKEGMVAVRYSFLTFFVVPVVAIVRLEAFFIFLVSCDPQLGHTPLQS